MRRHQQPMRLLDSAMVTASQQHQIEQARKTRLLTTVLLCVVLVALAVALIASATRAHAQSEPPSEVGAPPVMPPPAQLGACPRDGMCPRTALPVVVR